MLNIKITTDVMLLARTNLSLVYQCQSILPGAWRQRTGPWVGTFLNQMVELL